jgi:hypothetical protein
MHCTVCSVRTVLHVLHCTYCIVRTLRNGEVDVLHELLVSIRLAHALRLNDDVTQTGPWGYVDGPLESKVLLPHRCREHLFIAVQTGFRLCLTGLRIGSHPLQLSGECFLQFIILLLLVLKSLLFLLKETGIIAY